MGSKLKSSKSNENIIRTQSNMEIKKRSKTKTIENKNIPEITITQPLDIQGFNWTDELEDSNALDHNSNDAIECEGDDGNDEQHPNKKRKTLSRRQIEKQISHKEKELLQQKVPETADDYERLLVGSPNNSFLWMKYMAYWIQISELDKARDVAKRALQTIHYREEKEKMNVWVGWMNLENHFGDQEKLEKVVKDAALRCEPKKVYLHLVQVYEGSHKVELAEDTYKTLSKKFKHSCKVWHLFGLFYLKQNKFEESRKVLQQALKCLPKHKHIKCISKFAYNEFKYGEAERGRTIFEGIMSNYPKRVDLWNVYLDLEIGASNVNGARRLFERVIKMKFSSKKMKFFFKKYLEFEKKYGDETKQQYVKDEARRYVESICSAES